MKFDPTILRVAEDPGDDRLALLAGEMRDVLDGKGDAVKDVHAIIMVDDDDNNACGTFFNQSDAVAAMASILSHAAAVFKANGLTLEFTVDGQPGPLGPRRQG